ncbi:MAG TPA: tetratricopeptide repeat protein [Steroidobacteraceae bacterium]|jgi:Flp pilus assembly protein TadD|nr:tetratricopeptide repeat protein [Steroidobacteraceae bacterium]
MVVNADHRALQLGLIAIADLMQNGRLAEAERACRALLAQTPQQAPALHLLGLIREQSGDAATGEQLVRQSLQIDPANLKFRLNLAQLLHRRGCAAEAAETYRQVLEQAPMELTARRALAVILDELGRPAAAEAEVRTLLQQRPQDADASSLLAYLLERQNKLAEAEGAYRRALALDESQTFAHQNLGALLSRMERAEEALATLDRARMLGARTFELSFNRGRALSLLYRLEEAEREFVAAVALQPAHIEAQLNLARLRHMRADPAFARDFESIAAEHPGNLPLQAELARVFMGAGRFDEAERHLRQALVARGPIPALRALLAQLLQEKGRLAEAEQEALLAAEAEPDGAQIVETLVAILLARGRASDALPYLAARRAREPLVQSWIAYEATAARLLGQDSYRELFDYDRLVRSYTLEPPPGWSSMTELNVALRAALTARHRFARHPLDQSLRHGSQTTRNLIAESDAAIRAVLQAFEAPIADYLGAIGQDLTHPLSSRNAGRAVITGAWSVQLHREGFHVNHLHPQGWISSAYYVDVPGEVQDIALRSGWLKFGETRFPVPGATAEKYLQPVPGRLVLFPSYLWHGTTPIHGAQPRLTIAFDALPIPVSHARLE